MPDLIRKVNREDPEGVVLILPTRNPPVPRYEYGGGFNIVFHLEHSIILEKVGPGFDFLCNECHYDRELVEKNIPKTFRSFAGTEIAHNLMT